VDEVVSRYLSTVASARLSRRWPDPRTAPQNRSAIVTEVRICDEHGEPLDVVHTDTAFDVEIRFQVKTAGSLVGLTLIVHDSEQNIVFSSINNHEPAWYARPMPAGEYQSACRIPANFFNHGWFSIAVNLFGKGFGDAVMVRDVLRIEVQDSPAVRRDYFGPFGGVVRPLLAWRTSPVAQVVGRT
jgi:hypothetical protein